jgi:hypothetical protein
VTSGGPVRARSIGHLDWIPRRGVPCTGAQTAHQARVVMLIPGLFWDPFLNCLFRVPACTPRHWLENILTTCAPSWPCLPSVLSCRFLRLVVNSLFQLGPLAGTPYVSATQALLNIAALLILRLLVLLLLLLDVMLACSSRW